jgi:hypothetical protein
MKSPEPEEIKSALPLKSTSYCCRAAINMTEVKERLAAGRFITLGSVKTCGKCAQPISDFQRTGNITPQEWSEVKRTRMYVLERRRGHLEPWINPFLAKSGLGKKVIAQYGLEGLAMSQTTLPVAEVAADLAGDAQDPPDEPAVENEVEF